MNKYLLGTLLLLFISGILAVKTQQTEQQEGTRVVFFIQNQIQQPEDYVEINIEIKSQQPSLEQAISEAKDIVENVQNIVKKYCLAYAKNKKDCDDVVETSEYQIDPIYQLVRKVPTFVAFSVVHQTTAKVKEVAHIGKLADDILKSGVSKISSFEWKPLEEVDTEQQAVTQGIELVKSICSKIDLQLGRIVSVSQVTSYQDEQEAQQSGEEQAQEGEEEQEQEQEDSNVVYRFQIICQQKGGKSKK